MSDERAGLIVLVALIGVFLVSAEISGKQLPALAFATAHCVPGAEGKAFGIAVAAGGMACMVAGLRAAWRRRGSAYLLPLLLVGNCLYCSGYQNTARFQAHRHFREEYEKCLDIKSHARPPIDRTKLPPQAAIDRMLTGSDALTIPWGAEDAQLLNTPGVKRRPAPQRGAADDVVLPNASIAGEPVRRYPIFDERGLLDVEIIRPARCDDAPGDCALAIQRIAGALSGEAASLPDGCVRKWIHGETELLVTQGRTGFVALPANSQAGSPDDAEFRFWRLQSQDLCLDRDAGPAVAAVQPFRPLAEECPNCREPQQNVVPPADERPLIPQDAIDEMLGGKDALNIPWGAEDDQLLNAPGVTRRTEPGSWWFSSDPVKGPHLALANRFIGPETVLRTPFFDERGFLQLMILRLARCEDASSDKTAACAQAVDRVAAALGDDAVHADGGCVEKWIHGDTELRLAQGRTGFVAMPARSSKGSPAEWEAELKDWRDQSPCL